MWSTRRRESLGEILRHAREMQGLSLRQAARRILYPDGHPISYTYLQAIEKDRRRPSLVLLCSMAQAYDLETLALLVQAQKLPDVMRTYPQVVPTGVPSLLELLVWAVHLRFGAWHQLLPRILETSRTSARCCSIPPQDGTPRAESPSALRPMLPMSSHALDGT